MLSLALATLGIPSILGAASERWSEVVEHELRFARALAADGMTFGPSFERDVIGDRVLPYGCKSRPSKLHGLDDADIRHVNLYVRDYCLPWKQAWASILAPCDAEHFVPKWCKAGSEDLLEAHAGVVRYFDLLKKALAESKKPLERVNILTMTIDHLDDDLFRSLPGLIGDVSEMTSIFLEDAGPDDALRIGWLLKIKRLGDGSALSRPFREFLSKTSEATPEQQRLLEEVAGAIEGKSVPEVDAALLDKRFGYGPPPPPPPPAPFAGQPGRISALVDRLNEFYSLIRDERFDESWSFVAIDQRESRSKESYVRTKRVVEDGHELREWRIKSISVAGNIAKVLLETSRRERIGSSKSRMVANTESSFWIFEEGTWGNMVTWPRGWNDDNAVAVPLPSESETGGASETHHDLY